VAEFFEGGHDVGHGRKLFFERFEFVVSFAIEHGPAGGGEFLAERIGGGEVFSLFSGPAFFG